MEHHPSKDTVQENHAHVKEKISDIHSKHEYTIRLQGMLLNALEDYAKDRGMTPAQSIREILEQRMVREKLLPEWWWERRGIH